MSTAVPVLAQPYRAAAKEQNEMNERKNDETLNLIKDAQKGFNHFKTSLITVAIVCTHILNTVHAPQASTHTQASTE